VVNESQSIPPPRKTAAVTISGVLLLLLAAVCALVAFMATQGHFRDARASIAYLVGAAVFGYASLATIRRWRGWRIWAGTVSWGLIVISVLGLFAAPPPESSDRLFNVTCLIIIALAAFVLIAKRLERRPDFSAVFH
jgi:peptidoglycan/LPS O-acetylase OafA/YrhL